MGHVIEYFNSLSTLIICVCVCVCVCVCKLSTSSNWNSTLPSNTHTRTHTHAHTHTKARTHTHRHLNTHTAQTLPLTHHRLPQSGGRVSHVVGLRGQDVHSGQHLPARPGVRHDAPGPSLRHRAPGHDRPEERLRHGHVGTPLSSMSGLLFWVVSCYFFTSIVVHLFI